MPTKRYFVFYPIPKKIERIRSRESQCIFSVFNKFCGTGSIPHYVLSSRYLRARLIPASIYGLLQISSDIFELLETFSNNSDQTCKFSEDFRTLPKISKKTNTKYFCENFRRVPNIFEDFAKLLKNHLTLKKSVLNSFRNFPKISEDYPKIS